MVFGIAFLLHTSLSRSEFTTASATTTSSSLVPVPQNRILSLPVILDQKGTDTRTYCAAIWLNSHWQSATDTSRWVLLNNRTLKQTYASHEYSIGFFPLVTIYALTVPIYLVDYETTSISVLTPSPDVDSTPPLICPVDPTEAKLHLLPTRWTFDTLLLIDRSSWSLWQCQQRQMIYMWLHAYSIPHCNVAMQWISVSLDEQMTWRCWAS